MPVPALKGSVNLSYVHLSPVLGRTSNIISATYTRPLPYRGSFFTTLFTDLRRRNDVNVFAGVSFPLGADLLGDTWLSRDGRGGDAVVSAGVNTGRSGTAVGVDVTKPLRSEPGSFGYRFRDVEGTRLQQQRTVGFGYRGNSGEVTVTATQNASGVYGTGQFDGAVVFAGGGLFLGNRIDDAFAIVDVGAPDVDVSFDNRRIARTGANGKALVPGLRAYQSNKVSIDTTNLPLTASVPTTQEFVAPADRSGVVVDFGVKTDSRSAIVILTGRDGKPLTAGLHGKSQTGEAFVVGYDGRAFISGLQPSNTIVIELDNGTCRAEFPFASQGNTQPTIGSVPCQ
jgi:outer membrane usher protein